MTLKENLYVEEDKAKKCVNYPTEKYQSYRDCDDQYVQNWLPKNFRPFWAVDNFHNITENVFLEEYPKGLGNLIDGTQPPDCPLPCSTTTVDARIMTYSKSNEVSLIDLTFNPTVLVTSTDFIKTTLFTFLAEVGGSMGLWLGLGLLQAMELLVKYSRTGWRRIRCFFVCLFFLNENENIVEDATFNKQ